MEFNPLDFTGADLDPLSLDFRNQLARQCDDENQQDRTACLAIAVDPDISAAIAD